MRYLRTLGGSIDCGRHFETRMMNACRNVIHVLRQVLISPVWDNTFLILCFDANFQKKITVNKKPLRVYTTFRNKENLVDAQQFILISNVVALCVIKLVVNVVLRKHTLSRPWSAAT